MTEFCVDNYKTYYTERVICKMIHEIFEIWKRFMKNIVTLERRIKRTIIRCMCDLTHSLIFYIYSVAISIIK